MEEKRNETGEQKNLSDELLEDDLELARDLDKIPV